MPLGQLLIDRNVIDPSELEQAREHQKVAGGSLVESVLVLGFASAGEISALLENVPVAPESIEACGLDEQFLLGFVLKAVHIEGLETVPALSERLALSPFILDAVLDVAKELRLVEILGLAGVGDSIYRYALTSEGRERAVDAMERCAYVGPAPVPLDAYREQMARQTASRESLKREKVLDAFSHLVLSRNTLDRIGPAAGSSSAVLLYGAPGNGKTSLAEALGNGQVGTIFVPHAIFAHGQVIQVFDPSYHQTATTAAAADPDIDPRWAACRRPTIVAGGELTLEALELRFDPISNTYEAPLHMKATGGTFVIDDFGRQRVSPTELLNRWILPLERRRDYLTLHTGKKLEVPFDTAVVFSTNYPPAELMDEAALRRIPYKFEVLPPTRDEYSDIMKGVCEALEIAVSDAGLAYLLDTFYAETEMPMARSHPKFILEHVVARCRFEERDSEMHPELLSEAVAHLLVDGKPPALD